MKLIEVVQSLGLSGGVPAKAMTEVEAEMFGATHEQFGAALCERWKFPQSLVQAAGFHHRPLDLESGGRRLACVVAVADRLAGEREDGFRLDIIDLTIDSGVMEEIGLTAERLATIRERLGEAIEDAQAMLV
jgi:HD-like signal output (HDOD) protein